MRDLYEPSRRRRRPNRSYLTRPTIRARILIAPWSRTSISDQGVSSALLGSNFLFSKPTRAYLGSGRFSAILVSWCSHRTMEWKSSTGVPTSPSRRNVE